MIKNPTEERVDRMLGRIDGLFSRNPSGWGTRDGLGAIELLIAPFIAGRIRVRVVHLPLKACRFGLRDTHSTSSETLAHCQMKSAAIAWMKAEGATDAFPEQACVIGRADAYSQKACWVVECGHTAMRKLTEAVACPEPIRFTLIPFQNQTWSDGSCRRLVAADFEWDADLQGEVFEFQSAKRRAAMALMPDWSIRRFAPSSPATSFSEGGR